MGRALCQLSYSTVFDCLGMKPYHTFMPYRNPADQKAAARRHYLANRQKMINRAKDDRDRRKQEGRKILVEAKNKPCADCGVQYPYYVMQFDHLDGDDKEFNIGGAWLRYGFQRILDEIAKCDVVCANCHAERTHQRGYDYSVRVAKPKPDELELW